jgi:pimeloyl-ACP methyl ester carboxylesterase
MTTAARDVDRGAFVRVGEVDLWVDVVGAGVPVVLLAGADAPGFRWHPIFVDRLVDAGFEVVRFDHRDCGRSTTLGPDAGYLLEDLAADLTGLLDLLDRPSAHLVGRSMGGMVAQVAALDHRDRVRSLTLIGTSPGVEDDRLPGPDEAFVESMVRRLFAGPPDDPVERIDWLVELGELMAGDAFEFDRAEAALLARAELLTGWHPQSGHGAAVYGSPSRVDRLPEIDQPTLVVHGTADPVLPVEHGRALALGIDGAMLIEVDGLGHEAPPSMLDALAPTIVEHLRAADGWSG